MTDHIAVIDIGKTNVKLALVDRCSLNEILVIKSANVVRQEPPWPHFDVEGHWDFILGGLRDFHASHRVDAISITTHGASVALLDKKGELVAPILDYEFSDLDLQTETYDSIRPPFSETGSPRLTGGLNIGAQLFWQFRSDSALKERTHQIVTYPQYWGAKLTGVTATDVTSLGCHTDLWNPREGSVSSLAASLNITEKIAPVRKPSDVLGTILSQVAKQTGLPIETPVYCGIHDSNASLLPYIYTEKPPFSVISTGTWVVAMSIGGKDIPLNPDLDTLINVTALGEPAPSARFMGGREYDLMTGGLNCTPKKTDLDFVLSNNIMLLPAVVEETGPFKGRRFEWVGSEPEIGSGKREAAIALYLALVTAKCLSNIGHDGKIIVEGPFADNFFFLDMLTVAATSEVFSALGKTGTSSGAAMLASGPIRARLTKEQPVSVPSELVGHLKIYAEHWKRSCGLNYYD